MIAIDGSLRMRNYVIVMEIDVATEVLIDRAYFADSKPSGSGTNTFSIRNIQPIHRTMLGHQSQLAILVNLKKLMMMTDYRSRFYTIGGIEHGKR